MDSGFFSDFRDQSPSYSVLFLEDASVEGVSGFSSMSND